VDVIEDGVSSDQSFYDRVYTNKNHLVMNERDEIIPDENREESDASSIKSIVKHANQKSRKIKNTNRENNARRFLKQLDKMKSKVYKKRLTLQDYFEIEKQKIGYAIMVDDIDNSDNNSDGASDSGMHGSTKD